MVLREDFYFVNCATAISTFHHSVFQVILKYILYLLIIELRKRGGGGKRKKSLNLKRALKRKLKGDLSIELCFMQFKFPLATFNVLRVDDFINQY